MELFKTIQSASRGLIALTDERRSEIIRKVAQAAVDNRDQILAANELDLARMDKNDPRYDRLLLNESRIHSIAGELRQLASLPSPLNRLVEVKDVPSGLHLEKITVPLGVVGIIYEARPNVTLDVFGICFKSGNACVLKGGSDAENSNRVIVGVIRSVLASEDINPDVVTLLPSDRQSAEWLMNAVGFVDVIIPRGGKNLIDYVRSNARVPVIETGAGIVHTYVDESASREKSKTIIFNAKTRRVSVCNALDCLLVHKSRLGELPDLVSDLASKQVIIYADEPAYASLVGSYPEPLLKHAQPEHYGIEFLDYKMSIRTVSNIEEALAHIAEHSSRHSEAILTEDDATAKRFLAEVDAAVVYVNASTAFTDGAQFGLGAEIGISTQKLHARGPMALAELTSYKWLVKGSGNVRP
jgi:glutamate-5-semialdehyde dehydrogenase